MSGLETSHVLEPQLGFSPQTFIGLAAIEESRLLEGLDEKWLGGQKIQKNDCD